VQCNFSEKATTRPVGRCVLLPRSRFARRRRNRARSRIKSNGRRKFEDEDCSLLADSHCVEAPPLASAAFGKHNWDYWVRQLAISELCRTA
jgi:hypothetical protein